MQATGRIMHRKASFWVVGIKVFFLWTMSSLFPTELWSQYTMLHQQHETFAEAHFQNKLVKHNDIVALVERYSTIPGCTVRQIGNSYEGRSIHAIQVGSGKRNVMLWTQMHGDEPTATLAVFDILRFLLANDSLNAYRKLILDELSITIIPMLNPDGAAVFNRRNAQDIDINRDALDKNTPEAAILWQMAQELKPVFGFNLHDQSPYYSVGDSGVQTRIAFLAPAYMPFKDSLNDNRANAMRLISLMNKRLQQIIPGQVARFNDTYEPRAFGDQFQATGISTVLVESGGSLSEVSKQYNRKLHFTLLLDALHSIASKSYLYEGLQGYFDIPNNRRNAFDVILRNVLVKEGRKSEKQHVAINHAEFYFSDYSRAYSMPLIADFGSLPGLIGFKEMDMEGVELKPGRILSESVSISSKTIAQLLEEGYTAVEVKSEREYAQWKDLPLTLLYFPAGLKKGRVNRPFDFFYEKDGIRYIFINGAFHKRDEWLGLYGHFRLKEFYLP
jgi:hypothetical protein